MDYFLGLDVGTTGVKALLFNDRGKCLGTHYRDYSLLTPFPYWVEQSGEEIWEAVKFVLKESTKFLEAKDRVMIGLSTQGGTLFVLDEGNRPLRRAITWMDGRGREVAALLERDFGKRFLYDLTGYGIVNALPLATLLWLREYEAETFRRIARVAFVNDFITFRLTGVWCCDPSNAGISMLCDIRRCDWSDLLLDYLGLRREQLSPIRNSGSFVGMVLPSVCQEVGLPESFVFTGGHDQFCAAFAVGATREGVVHLSGGTAWAGVVPIGSLWRDPQFQVAIERHVVPDRFGALFSIPCGGAALKWFQEKVARADLNTSSLEDYAQIDKAVEELPAGSGGLFFFPYLVPVVLGNPTTAPGGFLGVQLFHHKYHFYRAVMEGIGYEVLRQVEYLLGQGVPIHCVRLSGGVAKSKVWTQIIAEILAIQGISLERVKIVDAPALGAAELAYLGWQALCGGRDIFDGGTVFPLELEVVEKEGEHFSVYVQGYNRYKRLLENLSER